MAIRAIDDAVLVGDGVSIGIDRAAGPESEEWCLRVLSDHQQRRRVQVKGRGLVHLCDLYYNVHRGRGRRRVAHPHPQNVLAVFGLTGVLTLRQCRLAVQSSRLLVLTLPGIRSKDLDHL